MNKKYEQSKLHQKKNELHKKLNSLNSQIDTVRGMNKYFVKRNRNLQRREILENLLQINLLANYQTNLVTCKMS